MRQTTTRTRSWAVTVALCALAGTVLGATPSTTYGTYSVRAPADSGSDASRQLAGRFGERSTPAGDVDGDGTTDLFVGQPFWDDDTGSGITDAGRVYVLDGAALKNGTTTVLYVIESPDAQANAKFGFFISALGDTNSNGTVDIAIGTNAQDVDIDGDGTPETDVGKAWVFDGSQPPGPPGISSVKNSNALYTLDDPDAQAGGDFGQRIGNGDVDGDGVSDVIVGAPGHDVGSNSDQGQAYVFDGTDGTKLYTVNLPTADAQAGARLGIAVQSPGDLGSIDTNGDPTTTKDQTADIFVNAAFYSDNVTNEGRSYLYSGADENSDGVLDGSDLLTRIDSPIDQSGSLFGFQDVKPGAPGDVNGDGTPDLYLGAFRQDIDIQGNSTKELDVGRAWVYDGAASINESSPPADNVNGEPLYEINDPSQEKGGSFGWSMDDTQYNHQSDTTPDLYVGQAPHHKPSLGSGDGGTYVFDGTDQNTSSATESASLFKTLELPTGCQQGTSANNKGPALGWTTTAFTDLDGDGEPDYVAGTPFFDTAANQDEGMLFPFMSDSSGDQTTDC